MTGYTVDELLKIVPPAQEGGGRPEGFANECICLFAQQPSDVGALGAELLSRAPAIIGSLLPLDNDASFNWDNARTKFALLPQANRGILRIEKGLKNPSAYENDCYYLRFFGFRTSDVPFNGPSQLIRSIADALQGVFAGVEVIEDTARKEHSTEAKKRQVLAWRDQNKCQYCGGDLGLFRKCKSCGRKN
ncbi:MAG: hypothetical protein LBK95_15515 [Bifidobacteriaceae bacterium]|jgi:hypothetical protein|nr:hypothetical protein [Bifidobacteriaceae bacterium]